MNIVRELFIHIGKIKRGPLFFAALILAIITACSGTVSNQPPGAGSVLAVETFLADMTLNVVGDRLTVETLLPIGVDLHTYQPSPQDIIKVANSSVLIINGGGIEGFLASLMENAGGDKPLITASDGIDAMTGSDEFPQGDPHYWMDPIHVIQYIENIRDGLIGIDPEGEQDYRQNAESYIQELNELDIWIRQQVDQIPVRDRKLITNHDSLGYFASRYGFEIIGSLIPGLSSEAAPSAMELSKLIDNIRSSGAKAIFLEKGVSTNLAEQISGETSILVVTDLYIGSLSPPDGPASTYIDMMKYNVKMIVDALN